MFGARYQGISQFYLHIPRSSVDGMNHTCLCFSAKAGPHLLTPKGWKAENSKWTVGPGLTKYYRGYNQQPERHEMTTSESQVRHLTIELPRLLQLLLLQQTVLFVVVVPRITRRPATTDAASNCVVLRLVQREWVSRSCSHCFVFHWLDTGW